MKKILSFVFVLVMVFAISACSQPAATDAPVADATEAESGAEVEAGEPAAEPLSMVYFCMNLGDLSFNDSGWQGVQDAAAKYGWEADVIELGNDTSTYENAFADAVDSGKYDIVVTQSNYGLSDLAQTYAPQYPDIKFIAFDMGASAEIAADNMFGIAYKQNEGSFLVGALAGKLTQTNKIGVFIFNDVPVGNDFLTGYIAGVRYSNPDAEVTVAYGGGTADAAKLQEISSAMFDSGVDVIYGVSGSAYPGLAKEATSRGGFEAGVYAIGVDTDMWTVYNASENAEYADVIITSMLKNVGDSVVFAIDHYMAGTLPWGTVMPMGIIEGAVGVADNSHYRSETPADVLDYMDALQEQVVSGEVEVPSYFDFADYDAFAAWRDQ
jgi:basic membrane protein A